MSQWGCQTAHYRVHVVSYRLPLLLLLLPLRPRRRLVLSFSLAVRLEHKRRQLRIIEAGDNISEKSALEQGFRIHSRPFDPHIH